MKLIQWFDTREEAEKALIFHPRARVYARRGGGFGLYVGTWATEAVR
jgi:hypothetical protein